MRRIWNRLVRGTRDESGFTLIELLVVLVILAAISAIAIPRVATTRTMAEGRAFTANRAIVQSAVERYHIEEGTWPTTDGAAPGQLNSTLLVPDYLSQEVNLAEGRDIDSYFLDADGNLTAIDPTP